VIPLLLVLAGVAQERSRDLVLTKSKEPNELPVYTASRALLVGIDRYDKLPKEAQLRFAAADAKAMRDVLVGSYGFPAANVKLLVDGDATLKNIRSALDDLANKREVGNDDRILVYFSGHGQTVASGREERGYLIPCDAKVDLSDAKDAGGYKKTCLPMQEVWDRLDPSPAKHVAVIADACFSGLLTRSRALEEPVGLSAYLTMPARQAITAGGRGQKTWEADEYGHGLFTYNLVTELQKRAKKPGQAFSLVDLFASIQDPTVKMSKGRQVPQYNPFFSEGQMLFFAPGVAGRAVGETKDVADAPKPAVLRIRTVPVGARVTVDGEPLTGGSKSFDTAGPVKIRVEADGYLPQDRAVDLKAGATSDAEIRLTKAKPLTKPQASRLSVLSEPLGATVRLGGKVVGRTPCGIDLKIVAPRTVALGLELAGYKTAQVSTTLVPGNLAQKLTVKLEAEGPSGLADALKVRRVASLDPQGEVRDFVASSDLKRAATVDANRAWTVYDLPSGRVLRRIAEPEDGYVRLSDDLRTLLTIRLLRNSEHSWITVMAESVEGPKTARVYSVNLGKASHMNFAGATNDRLVVCGREPGNRGAVATLDLGTGRSSSFGGSGSFVAGTATQDGKTLAILQDAGAAGYATNLVVVGDDVKLSHKTVSIEDSDVGRSVLVSPDGSTVLANTARRTADNRLLLRGFRAFDAGDGAPRFKAPDYVALGFLPGNRVLAQTVDGRQGAILDVVKGNVEVRFPMEKTWMSKRGGWIATAAGGKIDVFEIAGVR